MRFRWYIPPVMFMLLWGAVYLLTSLQGRDADDVAGWVAIGAAAVALARREVKK